MRGRNAVVMYGALLVIIWFTFYKLGMIKPEPKQSRPD